MKILEFEQAQRIFGHGKGPFYIVKPLKLVPLPKYVKFDEESENDNQIENFAGRFEVFDIFHYFYQ